MRFYIIAKTMKLFRICFWAVLTLASCSGHNEYHVSVTGDDNNTGSAKKPFKSISAAARVAEPGDIITVHKGTYRERIDPPRGGVSDKKRIIYRAAEGARVEIKGSEIVRDWEKIEKGAWKVTIPNTFFNNYNPYQDVIYGDWFSDKGRDHYTGEVYINGISMYQMDSLEKIINPVLIETRRDPQGSTLTWYSESNDETTTIYANFNGYDPNLELVEINVREAVFYPSKPGINFITVKGFHMSHAATQWAAPTAEQIGLIGTHWSKGWIIENNTISESKCSGITLGKDRASGHNVVTRFREKSGTDHYNEVILRALESGWSKENIGSHIVRNNTVFNCEQGGIIGSLGAVYSEISNNHIYDIWTKRLFDGAEIAGIKLHAPIDVIIKNNHIDNTHRAIWMDWMAQGTRVTGNLCYNNTQWDLFFEVNFGPYIVDNNIFLSRESEVLNGSSGGAYIHNLFYVRMTAANIDKPDPRIIPYNFAHSTEIAGYSQTTSGDDRFFNNIFIKPPPELYSETIPYDNQRTGYGLNVLDSADLPVFIEGNLYYNGAMRYIEEDNFIKNNLFYPEIVLRKKENHVLLELTVCQYIFSPGTNLITTELLGKTSVTSLPYESPDKNPIIFDTDYFGNKRNKQTPIPGPFENISEGYNAIGVWYQD
jgi:hypothetical protein